MAQFERIENTYLDSLQANFELFVDEQTGAKHVHLSSDDTNNAFMVAFPTRPTDSTGVAHILEHTTLCGSQAFPVRDPFFMMLRRSLNTYMNAFTSGDCTAYPFATQNRRDFDNLLSVYLDAVFFPLLEPLDFAQEGWRLDFSDDGKQLVFKGVVYNEMKGAMSAPSARLWQQLSSSLLPDTIYRINSGGEPLEIPNLDYAALQTFHQEHYHPSHAVFMTYGSFPASEHQALIAERVLSKFSPAQPHPKLALQSPFAAPDKTRIPYEVGIDVSTERKTQLLWGWVLGKTASVDDLLDAQILSAVLLENSASPLRQLLETTEFADAPSELCGIDDSAQQLVFAAGVEGSDEEHVDELERQIFELLETLASDGVAAETIEGIIDSIEMAQRDLGGNSYPYGLQLMSRMLPGFVYDDSPAALLKLEQHIEGLRVKARHTDYVPTLIRKYLLDNTHRTRIVMWPDPEKAIRDQQSEQSKLSEIKAQMDNAAETALREKIQALNDRQARVEDPDILPTVTLADVPTDVVKIQGEEEEVAGRIIHTYSQPTNGLFYANVIFDISSLNAEEMKYLPFFTEFLLELGCGSKSYTDTQERRSRLGVFGAYASARNQPVAIDTVNGRLVISAKTLAKKTSLMVAELSGIMLKLRLDETERLTDLVVQERADAESSVIDRGHEIAMLGAAAGLTPSASLDDYWQGPTSILLSQQLEKAFENNGKAEELNNTFLSIRTKLLSRPCQILYVGERNTIDEALVASRDIVFDSFEGKLLDAEQRAVQTLPAAASGVGWLTSSQINFCARAHSAVAVGDPAVAPLMVLGKYLQDGFLHPAIREAGGAYGSGAQYDAESSTFRFFSYRDPRIGETFDDFARSVDWLSNHNSADRLQESILGVIRQLDKPKTPAGSAIAAFYDEQDGVGYEFRKNLRAQVLETSYADLVAVAERFLADGGQLSVVTDGTNEDAVTALNLQPKKLT